MDISKIASQDDLTAYEKIGRSYLIFIADIVLTHAPLSFDFASLISLIVHSDHCGYCV